jgi:SAM-dependent methyltransferase
VDRKAHWEQVYRTKSPTSVSWYQPEAALSAQLIEQIAPDRTTPIIDVGAGASVLVDQLLDAGYLDLTVADIAGAALELSRERLGPRAASVQWLEGDIVHATLRPARFQLWHDRAVFHFLTEAADRAAYLAQVTRALAPGGHLLLATFAEDGPTRCSGLDVVRYSPEALLAELGDGFEAIEAQREEHHTPAGSVQYFTYLVCQRTDGSGR